MNKVFTKWLKLNNVNIVQRLKEMTYKDIDESFGRELQFNTFGLRAKMLLGSGGINEVTVCKLASTFLSYCKRKKYTSVAVGFDVRNNSTSYGKILVNVLSFGGLCVHTFSKSVSSPMLAFATIRKKCDAGIMISGGHNDSSYSGIQFYKKNGVLFDVASINEINKIYSKLDEVQCFNSYEKNKFGKNDNIKIIGNDFFREFSGQFYKNKLNSTLNVIYTPLNGNMGKDVVIALKKSGFKRIVCVNSQFKPSGNFKTFIEPDLCSFNVYERALKKTDLFDADVILATSPSGEEFGAMIKSTKGYQLLSGNEIAILLLNYINENKVELCDRFAVASVITSPLFYNICDKYGIECTRTQTNYTSVGNAKIKLEGKYGKDGFTIAFGDNHGYIVKDGLYNKDSFFTLLKFCEMASFLKNSGSSIEEYLHSIYQKFGFVYSITDGIRFNENNAKEQMNEKMENLRKNLPNTLLKRKITKKIDYLYEKTGIEPCDMIELNTKDFKLFIRPSMTENKIKIYVHCFGKSIDDSKKKCNEVLQCVKKDIFGI